MTAGETANTISQRRGAAIACTIHSITPVLRTSLFRQPPVGTTSSPQVVDCAFDGPCAKCLFKLHARVNSLSITLTPAPSRRAVGAFGAHGSAHLLNLLWDAVPGDSRLRKHRCRRRLPGDALHGVLQARARADFAVQQPH